MCKYSLTQTLEKYKFYSTMTLYGEEHENYEDAIKELDGIRNDISKNSNWSELTTSDGKKYKYNYHDPVLDDDVKIIYNIEKIESK